MVGRWRSGAPLVLSPDADRADLATANDFGYHHEDVRGLRCPHRRPRPPRQSPRLAGSPTRVGRLEAVTDRHRLLRRGRVFADDGQQGLHFLALNANLGRQFEFVQHSWLNDPKFAGLTADLDPLLTPTHPGRVFTIPDQPFRTRFAGLPEFVTTLGGAYFFLPGLRALRIWAARRFLSLAWSPDEARPVRQRRPASGVFWVVRRLDPLFRPLINVAVRPWCRLSCSGTSAAGCPTTASPWPRSGSCRARRRRPHRSSRR